MRKAIVRATLIENVAEVAGGSDWTPPAGTTAVDDPAGQASPGGTYDGSKFIQPPVPIEEAKPVLTTEQKLAKLNITVEELKAVLAK